MSEELEDLYLGKKQFFKFLEAIPKLEMYHNLNSKKPRMSPFDLQVYFMICYYTCIRPGAEAQRLRKKDFKLDSGILEASNLKGGYRKTTIPSTLIPILRRFLDNKSEAEALFPYSRQWFYKLTKQIGELAGIEYFETFEHREVKGLYLYVFKHAYIQRLEFEGCPPSLISIKARHRPDSGRGMARQTANYAKSLRGLKIWESQHITDDLESVVNIRGKK